MDLRFLEEWKVKYLDPSWPLIRRTQQEQNERGNQLEGFLHRDRSSMEALGQDDTQCIRISKEESDIVSEMSGPFNEASSVEKSQTSTNPREQTRRGSTCKQIRPLPTFVKSESHCDNDCDKMFIKKVSSLRIIIIKGCIKVGRGYTIKFSQITLPIKWGVMLTK